MNNNDDKKVVPLIVNGEINDGRNKKQKHVREEKLPTKRFTFGDVFLTLVALGLVVYGVFSVINPKEKENKESNSNVQETKKEEVTADDLKKYIPVNLSDFYNLYSKDDINNFKIGLSAKNLSNNAILSLASRLAPTHGNSEDSYYLEEDIDAAVKKLFGNITYTKSKFSYGDYEYTYNQETKRYYLLSNSIKTNSNVKKYDYLEVIDNKDSILIKDYLVYSYNNSTLLIDGTKIALNIDDSNIKDNKDSIKYIEYKFDKNEDNYILSTITIK